MTVLAVDLGGPGMRAALVEPDASVHERLVAPTPHDQPCADALTRLVRVLPGRGSACCAVVGVPGRVRYAAGRLEHAPNLPPGWVDSLSESRLVDALGLPVHLANDADLATVGEHRFGADDAVFLTLATGVGEGAVLAAGWSPVGH